MNSPMEVGTAIMVLNGPHDDWIYNDNRYQFPERDVYGVAIAVFKELPWALVVRMTGIRDFPIEAVAPVPVSDATAVMLLVEWNPESVSIRVNMSRVWTFTG